VLETRIGNVPVYNSVREGLADGYRFNCGVVYLPPSAARDGVAELIRVNPDLKKIFIVTEKMSVHDAREIRAMGQSNGIDIFGGNSLGVADAWNAVRIGGALGGDTPSEALRKGSIAIYSNSGNFTTTIATYLRMAGWGTTTLISSGKDVYIHYAAPEFAFALANDARSKAVVAEAKPQAQPVQAPKKRKIARSHANPPTQLQPQRFAQPAPYQPYRVAQQQPRFGLFSGFGTW